MKIYPTPGFIATSLPVNVKTKEIIWTTNATLKTLKVALDWVTIEMTYEEAYEFGQMFAAPNNGLPMPQYQKYHELMKVSYPTVPAKTTGIGMSVSKGYVDAQLGSVGLGTIATKEWPEPKAEKAHERIDILQKVLAEIFGQLSSAPGVEENVLKKLQEAEDHL